MTSERTFPQVFLDANALIRFTYSITHHLFDSEGRKSYVRLAVEKRIFTVTTGYSQYNRTLEMLSEGSVQPRKLDLPQDFAEVIIRELDRLVKDGLIKIVKLDRDLTNLCGSLILEKLLSKWSSLVSWDLEDNIMIKEAAFAYAEYSLIMTRKYCKPRPFAVITGDKRIHSIGEELNENLFSIIYETGMRTAGANLLESPGSRLIITMDFSEFKKHVKDLLREHPII